MPTTPFSGGCLCGRVRYTLTGEPLRSGLCHCRDCQRFTGSAFEPVLFFPAAALDLQGELKTFDVAGRSGKTVHRRFCPNCGSGIITEAEARPGMILVAAGTLDDPTGFTPSVEIFCDDAQPWVHSGGERKRFPTVPG